MQLRDLAPRRTERGVLVGCTGSGKTTLAKCILPLHRYVVAIDPKCTLGASSRGVGHLSGYELVRKPGDLPKAGKRFDRIQYRPDHQYQNRDDWERVYAWVFERGNCFCYTDEVYLIMDGNRSPDSFRACITSGRELGIGMLHATQRPAQIDVRIVTEAEQFYCFQLRRDIDRIRMADAMGDKVIREPARGHSFWYQGPTGEPRLLKLKL